MIRTFLCWVMLVVFPSSLLAADTNAAMLYAKGTAWVNGGAVTESTAVFPGDLVQTKAGSMADLNASGSNVMIRPDSFVKFEGNGVAVDHGSVSIKTAKSLRTHTEDLTVSPTSNAWTEFEVANLDGKIKVMVLKGDVSVSDGSGTSTLSQGQQTTRDMSARKKKRRDNGAPAAAGGGVLDSPIVVGIGAAAIAGMMVWVSLQSPNPASPAVP
jgi:ferric-dicitrate binding protein FerR (iron transport regulator)